MISISDLRRIGLEGLGLIEKGAEMPAPQAMYAISIPDYPALVADALRRFSLGEYTETEIVGKIMKERGGNANPLALREEIRRQTPA